LFDSLDQCAPALGDEELDERLALALARSHILRARRARRRALAGSLAAVLVLGVVMVVGVVRPGAPTRPAKVTAWELVSYVDPSWQQLPSVGFASGFGLDCPTTSTCYAVDNVAEQVEVTSDGGNSWRHVALPDGFVPLSAIACTDAISCSLLGSDGAEVTMVATSDGGTTWVEHALGVRDTDATSVGVLACSTATSCIAAVTTIDDSSSNSSTVLMTHDGGATWSSTALVASFDPLGGACVGGSCVLVGSGGEGSSGAAAYASSDGGSSWSPAAVPAGVGPLVSVACATPVTCVGGSNASNDVLTSHDGGQSWQEMKASGLPDAIRTSLSCASASACWASGVVVPTGQGSPITFADAEGFLASTSDGGASWHQAPLPIDIRAVAQISCPSTATCFALAYHKTSSDDGSFVLLSRQG
jgi:hypothetical protein